MRLEWNPEPPIEEKIPITYMRFFNPSTGEEFYTAVPYILSVRSVAEIKKELKLPYVEIVSKDSYEKFYNVKERHYWR